MRTLFKAIVYGAPERENPVVFFSIRSVDYMCSDSIRCVSIHFVSIRCVSIHFVKYTFREYTFCEYSFCKCIDVTDILFLEIQYPP
jgi:hypothetical protein